MSQKKKHKNQQHQQKYFGDDLENNLPLIDSSFESYLKPPIRNAIYLKPVEKQEILTFFNGKDEIILDLKKAKSLKT